MRAVLAAAALLAALPAQQVVAPATAGRPAVTAAKDGLVLPAGEFTVIELVDAVAAFLCRNYLFDPTPLLQAPGFTLQRPIALDALGAEELLYALLSTRDLAVLPLDEARGVWQIVSLAPERAPRELVAATPWRTADEILRRRALREIVVTAIDLERADAQAVAGVLRAAFASIGPWRPGALLASAADRRFLVLHGYRETVAQAILLARLVDRHAEPAPDGGLLARLARLEREVAELRAQLANAQRAAVGR